MLQKFERAMSPQEAEKRNDLPMYVQCEHTPYAAHKVLLSDAIVDKTNNPSLYYCVSCAKQLGYIEK